MAEKPILFSTPMAQAILARNKTMTRRVVKNLDLIQDWGDGCNDGALCYEDEYGDWHKTEGRCPYGKLGDYLWVKEMHYAFGWWSRDGYTKTGREKWRFEETLANDAPVCFFDNPPDLICTKKSDSEWGYYKRNSLFMPKRHARTWLRVKDVRVERLREIENKPRDAWAEGCRCECTSPVPICKGNIDAFQKLWDSLNGEPRPNGQDISWTANPWVWVVEFERAEKPPVTEDTDSEILSDLLSLVCEEAAPETIDTWTPEQKEQARDWAAKVHLGASDNIVRVPEKPDFLAHPLAAKDAP